MNILFILNGPTTNRGCEAILLSTADLLREIFPDAHFINSSTRDARVWSEPYLRNTEIRHRCNPEPLSLSGVVWQFNKRIRRRAHYFENFLPWADYVFSLGGDTYSLDYGTVGEYFRANERVLASGKKLVIWGASIGPFSADPETERYAAEHLKQVHLIVARERRTVDYLASIGVADNVVLMPDPAFSLTSEQVELPDEIERMLSGGAIGVNLSPLLARYRGGREGWLRDAADWITALIHATDRPILLIPHVFKAGNDDQEFLGDVLSRIAGSNERVALLQGRSMSSRQLKRVISRLACFVGARTHATIAAFSASVPTLSIGYSIKARGINEDFFGHDGWVVDHKNLDAPLFVSKIVKLLSEKDDITRKMRERNSVYKIYPEKARSILSV
ncbi:polysaccharide pyruvyl transferase family protein [Mesorhizobium sp.]|uniref:polysaccharide pyruvyl transferase family protein n=1 Tax=Mesorhizobium sp. TaxID=1871066 RepID=UPI001200FB49|nr:polysaccharide pyruvyl transferase family protein [Mesorhizobium sp.]TIN26421.1 MAG: polysaccharide pyruvyl transferase family protein [Mesorhizobium sp.]